MRNACLKSRKFKALVVDVANFIKLKLLPYKFEIWDFEKIIILSILLNCNKEIYFEVMSVDFFDFYCDSRFKKKIFPCQFQPRDIFKIHF